MTFICEDWQERLQTSNTNGGARRYNSRNSTRGHPTGLCLGPLPRSSTPPGALKIYFLTFPQLQSIDLLANPGFVGP